MAWREIEGGKWPYRVSDKGEVQVQKNGAWLPLKVWVHAGQPVVYLRGADGTKNCTAVTRLVARAFIGPIPDGYCVRHRDRIKLNNMVENLDIVPKGQANALCRGTRRRPVFKIDRSHKVVEVYGTLKEAAEKNYVSRSTVLRRCQKKVMNPFKLTGYSFRYEEKTRKLKL